ncbi:MAG: glycosyltransferase family 2 protein [Bacteroidales bacterium]|nr:glycosyltransferase family 2 protein [Bacteroidales bacterium]
MTEITPLVSVCTLAYNHAPYIRECLDGILMQKTNFAFELLIHDDASTDGTADIIREYEAKYPDIVKPIYQTENQYSKGVKEISILYQYPRAKGKYIAMCEGDDYWTDPLKLQKQVDFMEANPHVSCCFHTVDIYQENTKKYSKGFIPAFLRDNSKVGEFFTNENRNEAWFAYILAIMYRREDIGCLNEQRKKYKFTFNDNHIIYYLMKDKQAYFFRDSMAVYRKNDGGIFGNKSEEYKLNCTYNISKELYLNEPDIYTKYQYMSRIKEILKFYIKNREYVKAFKWKKNHYKDLNKSYLYICSKILINLFKIRK